MERIGSRLAGGGAFALVLVDASCLGSVERLYGGEAYERAMQGLRDLLGEFLTREMAEDDLLITREPGGDEICALLFHPRGDSRYREAVFDLPRRISEELERGGARAVYPYVRGPLNLPVGLAVALHNPTLSAERQLRRALHDARRDAELEAREQTRRRRCRLLQVVLAGDLGVRFEPIVELRSGDALGYEALVRGPEGTSVHLPRQLFGLAEEMGLIFELDSLCRRAALERAATLPRGKKLFLNCLPTAVRDPDFRDAGLRKSLEKLQLRPSDLVLEISEKESIGNFTIFREMRDAYRDLGVRIAIDDAGVGYASLEAIMEVAPDYVKADLALVRGIDSDPPRQEALRALNALAQRIGATVIAEGIETAEEFRTVRDLGILYGQGFYLGRPYSVNGTA